MIIGVVGRAGSGKDTVADLLVKNHGFTKVSIADPMKRFLSEVLGFTDEQLWGGSSHRNEGDPRFLRSEGYAEAVEQWKDKDPQRAANYARQAYLTPRYALQQLGTEWGRHCYQDVWIDYALRVAEKLLEQGSWHDYTAKLGLFIPDVDFTSPKGVVFSDVRFPNEAAAIRKKGGVLWRTTYEGKKLTGAAAWHESERYIDNIMTDAEVAPLPLEMLPGAVALLLDENPSPRRC